jgi:hypothetical protein
VGIIGVALIYILNPMTPLLAIALVLLALMLFSMMRTRIEMAPSTPRGIPVEAVPPPRNEHPR